MNKIRNAERRDAKNASLYYLYKCISKELLKFAVVPHAGTWIEIRRYVEQVTMLDRRSPRGNVD